MEENFRQYTVTLHVDFEFTVQAGSTEEACQAAMEYYANSADVGEMVGMDILDEYSGKQYRM